MKFPRFSKKMETNVKEQPQTEQQHQLHHEHQQQQQQHSSQHQTPIMQSPSSPNVAAEDDAVVVGGGGHSLQPKTAPVPMELAQSDNDEHNPMIAEGRRASASSTVSASEASFEATAPVGESIATTTTDANTTTRRWRRSGGEDNDRDDDGMAHHGAQQRHHQQQHGQQNDGQDGRHAQQQHRQQQNHRQEEQRQRMQQKRCSRHFFSQEPPKLCSIIYAEFDNDIGRVIRFQVPDEIFDKQRFDTISSAIIPSEEMRDRMIKINIYDYKITGYPVGIKDKKYKREVFIFNLCFVVAASDSDEDVDDSIYYEPLAQKCAEYLVELEQERCFLSKEKHRLPALMRQIYDGLNQKGECVCPITDQTTIYLRLCPAFLCREPPPHPLSPFLVPIFSRLPPPITRAALNRMDVLSQKIFPQIDGVRCIKDIACAVQIDSDLVGRYIRNLCFHGCVALLPQFLYSNCYVPTERLRHFFDSPQTVEKCLNFVRLRPFSDDPSPVLFNDVARLYLGLKIGSPLSEWLLRMGPRQLRVDERKLIQFGLFYGILRKQQIYPVAFRRDDGTKIAALCDGEHSLDDLALHYTLSPIELQRLLAENGNFRFIAR